MFSKEILGRGWLPSSEETGATTDYYLYIGVMFFNISPFGMDKTCTIIYRLGTGAAISGSPSYEEGGVQFLGLCYFVLIAEAICLKMRKVIKIM